MTVIATAEGVRAPHVVVPLPEPAVITRGAVARLGFDNGLEGYDLRGAAHLDGLLEAHLAEPLPVVWADDRNVHVEYPLASRVLHRPRGNTVGLNTAVPWALDVHGGAAHLDADLAGTDIRSVTFHAGAAHIRLALAHPTAPCTIRLTSVKDLRIERPADVPIRLEVAKGAAKVSLDDRRYGAVGGGLSERTHHNRATEPGYCVIISGSADTLVISGRAG
jgi:hypothetical protein